MKSIINDKNSFRNYLYKRLLIIALISLFGTGYFWISTAYKDFRKDELKIREEYVESQKEKIYFQVNNAIDYLGYNQNLIEQRLQNNIKSRVQEVHAIISNIYEANKESKSKEQITKMIEDAISPIRFNKGRGYFFVEDISEKEKAIALVLPGKIGENRYNVQDIRGKFYVQEMINLLRTEGEGFINYYRELPNGDQQQPKISFVKLFEPYNWLIGTGEYLSDVEKDIRQESLNRLSRIRFDEHGYIFVNSYAGDTLIKDGLSVNTAENLWEYEDKQGNKVIQMEREVVDNSEGGYIEYYWNKIGSTTQEKKISFIRGFSDWQWMIGAGFYVDDIQPEIDILKSNLKRDIKTYIIKILLILISLSFIILIIGRYSYKRVWEDFQVFMNFFHKAEDEAKLIEKNSFNILEFRTLAESANRMIKKRNNALQLLKDSEAKYRALFQNMQNGLAYHKVVFDNENKPVDYVFLTVNATYEKLTGLSSEKIIGKKVTEIIPNIENDSVNWIEVYGKVAETGQSLNFESYAESLQKWYKIQAYSPQKGYFATIVEDITKVKKIESESNENRDRLKIINKLLRHDLTNDFSVIRSAINLYQKRNDPTMLDEVDQRVSKGLTTINMVRKQEALLNLHYNLAPVNPLNAIANIINQYPKISFKVEGSCLVFADDLLFSVFDNLTSNAINHGKASEIEITLQEKEEYCHISFADNGSGIPDKIKPKIFEEEFKYGETGNSGIGLYLVFKTIKRYNGLISVRDNTPKGTIFEIKLRKFSKI